ncbi:MAG: hypothetical protein WB821_10205 [Burkholderiaceae bacterium]
MRSHHLLRSTTAPLRAASAWLRAWVCVGALACMAAHAATPAGTDIVNTARLEVVVDNVSLAVDGSRGLRTSSITPSKVSLAQVLPAAQTNAPVALLQPTACRNAAGAFNLLPAPTRSGVAVPTNSNVFTSPGTALHAGEPALVTLTDYDQNRDLNVAETVLVTLRSQSTGDVETLRLSETGPSTGVFSGYIQTVRTASAPSDCLLGVSINDKISVQYHDAINGDSDTSTANVLVDPLGRVFDSRTGALINGATVVLINADTGAPAVVFGDDGVTRYPSTMVSGSAVTDSAGNVFTYAQGAFRFPLVAPGNYRLLITPPSGYSYPSAVLDSVLQLLPGAVWQLNAGSRGGNFAVPPGLITVVDIPLDPRLGQLELTKTSAQANASAGDFVAYTLSLRNPDTAAVSSIVLHDQLPPGLRVQAGSMRLKSGSGVTVLTPVFDKAGSHMQLNLPDMAAGETFTINYVAEVTVATRIGNAVNTAQATGAGSLSNSAQATVRITDELMATTSVLVGRVFDHCDPALAKGIAGVRVQMEDGRMNLSDPSGRWHFENVRSGNHVVQVDRTSLPVGYTLKVCEVNSRSAKNGHAQMLDLKPGSLWQVNFVATTNAIASPTTSSVTGTATVPGSATTQLAGTVAAGYDADWLATAPLGNAIEFPAADFIARTSAVGLAVRHLGALRAVAFMNGQAVHAIASDGSILRTDKALAVSLWRGLPVHEGKNLIKVQLQDAQGQVVQVLEREVYYSSIPVAAQLVAASSRLLADGRTPIVLAMRLTDAFKRPLRAGMTGAYELEGQYAVQRPLEPSARDPLADTDTTAEQKYVVGEDGIARIELAPSTVPGPLVLKVALANGKVETLRTWVDVVQREWMVVGLAEDTLYGKKLKQDLRPLAGAPGVESLDHTGRVALYAVGTIARDTLLTLAYDSAKERPMAGDQLAQAFRSDEQYLVYADASNPTQAALSSSKLYVRIDRAQFSALFGDFSTDLGGGSLTQFNRSLTGLRAQYRGEQVQVVAFAARTGAGYSRDEIALDGTPAALRLSRRDIVPGTDKLKIQVRNNTVAQEIIEERTLSRFVNYRIDYASGQVVLANTSQLPAFGQRLVLVAEYETSVTSQAETVAGVRVSVPVPGLAGATSKGELGVKLVRDNTSGLQGGMAGIDLVLPIGANTTFKAEHAGSQRLDATTTNAISPQVTGKAWLAELAHQTADTAAKAYVKQTDGSFGLGTLGGAAVGLRTTGAQVQHKINDSLAVTAQAETGSREASGAAPALKTQQISAGLQGQVNAGDALQAQWSVGVKDAREGDTKHVELLTAGVGLGPKQGNWNVRLETEQTVSSDKTGLNSAPEKWLLNGTYKLNAVTELTAGQQWLRAADGSASLAQVGMRYSPADWGVWSAGLGQGAGSQGQSLPMLMLGVEQRMKLDEGWSVGGSYARQQWSGVDSLLGAGAAAANSPVGLLDNYQSLALELNRQRGDWTYASRAQWRRGNALDTDAYGVTAYRKLGEGVALSGGGAYRKEEGAGTRSRALDLRLAWSRRASESRWAYLHRLDYVDTQKDDGMTQTKGKKLLSNLHANYAWADNSQISLHHGAKQVLQVLEAGEYAGLTQFASAEGRMSLGANWDVGANVFGAYSSNAQVRSHGLGASVGVKLADSAWISLGYNFMGLRDGQFNDAAHTAKGLYLRLRWRFDQDTFHLNSASPVN